MRQTVLLSAALLLGAGPHVLPFCEGGEIPIQADTLDGRTFSGSLLEIGSETLRMKDPLEMNIGTSVPASSPQPQLSEAPISSEEGKASVLSGEFPTRSLRVLRFRADLPADTVRDTQNIPKSTPHTPPESKETSGSKETSSGNGMDELRNVMLGGSLLKVRSVTLQEGVFHLEPAGGGETIQMKRGEIPEILFQGSRLGQNKDLDADWEEIQGLETNEDLLVVFRNEKLNFYYGTILELTDKAVRFEQDGESISVRLRHIFAIRFASNRPSTAIPSGDTEARGRTSADPETQLADPVLHELPLLGILTDEFGSELFISSLTIPENDGTVSPDSGPDNSTQNAENAPSIRCLTTAGHALTLPIRTLQTLDLTQGRTVFLADLKAESTKWTPYFPLTTALAYSNTQTAGTSGSISGNTSHSPTEENGIFRPAQAFYAPRINQGFSGKAIRLAGKEYANGLELTSRTQMVFRLPGAFRKFETLLGIDDLVRPGGSAEVSILADDRLLFQETITGKDAPKPLSLDISGARRLTILVDFGEEGNLSDHAAFANAQLVK
ncbi:MAG: NPCBM/NEW2 domain-containing protein [Thermoguttaceae bacterium]|nr:NPCBM/NEW2 domain-containing protein [Thermoguttaceae bacterium]